MVSTLISDIWERGDPYEQYVGRWSRVVAPLFLAWLNIPAGRTMVQDCRGQCPCTAPQIQPRSSGRNVQEGEGEPLGSSGISPGQRYSHSTQ